MGGCAFVLVGETESVRNISGTVEGRGGKTIELENLPSFNKVFAYDLEVQGLGVIGTIPLSFSISGDVMPCFPSGQINCYIASWL